MTKKIFTLFAAALLCGSGVANAQVAVPTAKHTAALKQGGLYHISDGTKYLFVSDGDTLKYNATAPKLAPTLWCVNAEKPVGALSPEFTFQNKGTGLALGVDLTEYKEDNTKKAFPAVLTYSDASVWKFSNSFQSEMDASANYLMTYLPDEKDLVAVLTTADSIVYVEIVKAPVGSADPATTKTLLKFNLYDAAPLHLTANDFNKMFGSTTESVAKGFDFIDPKSENLNASPLKDKFIAKDVTAGGLTNYIYLTSNEADNDDTKYLRVDTATYNNSGDPYLKFAYSTKKEYDNLSGDLKNQHYFRLTYLPSVDSMIVNVHKVKMPKAGEPGTKYWADWQNATYTSVDTKADIATKQSLIGSDLNDKTYVKIQDLTDSRANLTIGNAPVQTWIGFGFTGCDASGDDRTTREGIYVIKNKAGKYLQVPIHTTDTTWNPLGGDAQWVTLEKNVDPMQMPSFQWVVKKTRTNDPNNVSAIKIENREYRGVVPESSLQLYKDFANKILGAELYADLDKSFEVVPEELRMDPYLGYKYVPADVAEMRTYTFNYLHEYNDGQYMSVKNDASDSLLYISEAKDAFALIPYHHDYNATTEKWSYAPVAYGPDIDAAWVKAKKGVQLKRTAYALKTQDGNKFANTNKVVVAAGENRFAVAGDRRDWTIAAGDSAVFYLKTNNTKLDADGNVVNYYALVDTASTTPNATAGATRVNLKAGVDDNNLWVKIQSLSETRTSAFAVEESVVPLYRRFNRAVKDGQKEGSDKFYGESADSDSPIALRFHRMNNKKELLYEDRNSVYSKGKGINFLGVKHTDDFDGLTSAEIFDRTTLLVDTAYVRRPASKTSTGDTPKPQYLLAVAAYNEIGTTAVAPETDCDTGTTKDHPYTRGRYLINATDSVYGLDANGDPKWYDGISSNEINDVRYIWDTKWERLVFTEAVHLYDTLYILNGQKHADPIDIDKLRADTKVTAINLGENNYHKDVVFSFRLIENEEKLDYVDQVQDFLIESETEARGVEPVITPFDGGWVKIQNGVPVISRGAYGNAITEAEKFNVVTGGNPVANEVVDLVNTAVSVIAGNGSVTILNAANKNVVVTNILGQVVANAVLTSDNATIAAPKGLVIVSVEGASAFKAIVK